jgi:hypothetical protein
VLDPKLVVTSAAAYATIQGYYNYCLPQSIEGILLEKIAGSKATVTDPGGGTPPAGGAAPLAAARSSASVPARMVTPKIILQ